MNDKLSTDDFKFVMQSVIARTRSYFASEYDISVSEPDPDESNQDALMLRETTAIIGLGGRVNVLIAFSFENRLICALYERMTEGFAVAPDEVEMYREAAAGEVVNTILGNCTIDLQTLDRLGISMTPPLILNEVKTIRRMKGSQFYRSCLNTAWGAMTVCLIGPREQFSTRLEYAK